jgi:hypothetical protein
LWGKNADDRFSPGLADVAPTTLSERNADMNEAAIDLVIDDLAAENAMLCEHLRDLEADRDVYRELLVATLDALAEVTTDRNRQREQKQRVVHEYRALRERLLLQAGADDPPDVAA